MVSPATPNSVTAGNGAKPNRLNSSSRLTTKQQAFAKLIATGLNSAAAAYRQAYKINSTKEWWCRVAAYDLLQKPHVQALVSKLRAEYDTVRPALSRTGKREILRDMAINDELDPMDRQRAIDIDNKMQSEYSERMHLTGDVTISMFRASEGKIPWQLAEDVIDVQARSVMTPAQAEPKPVLAIQDQGQVIDIADCSHSKAIPSSPADQGIPEPVPAQPSVSKRTGQPKAGRRLKPIELAALRGTRLGKRKA